MTIADTLLKQYETSKNEDVVAKNSKLEIKTMSGLTLIHTLWVFEDDSYIVKAYLSIDSKVITKLATPDPKWVREQFKQWLKDIDSEFILVRLFTGNARRIKSNLRKLPLILQP